MPGLEHVGELVRDLVRDLTTPEKKPPSAPPAPPVSPFQERTDRTLTTLTWLVGALAAVASLAVAGTQLGSIGRLDWEEDGLRLAVAAGGASLALALVVVAVGLIAWARLPDDMIDLPVLEDLADPARDRDRGGERQRRVRLRERVAADPTYHRGQGGLGELLVALKAADQAFVAAAPDAREDAAATVTRYRNGVQNSAWLYAYMRFQHKARVVLLATFGLAVVVALALVAVAWAANPAVSPATTTASAEPSPVAATLVLASADGIWSQRLGDACATTARTADGIRVIALATDADGVVSGVTVPDAGGGCAQPRRFTVGPDDGTVRAETDALGR